MGGVARSEGYRRYSAEFKREQVDRILRGEVTAAELSRELGVARSDRALEVSADQGRRDRRCVG
jgi:transposase-like protein